MHSTLDRRGFLRKLGISTAALPFLCGLPQLHAAVDGHRRQRLIFVFSPNGTLPKEFWPQTYGENFEMRPILEIVDDNTPEISRIQIDLMVNALANDMARVASLQFFRATGQGRLRWLGIDEGHHTLSHEPDNNKQAYKQLLDINLWFAGEVAHLARRLRDTPEPNGPGNILSHTTSAIITRNS